MILHSGAQSSICKVTQKITQYLSLRDKKWDSIQQFKLKKRITSKLSKETNTHGFENKLLIGCKSWSGPCTSAEETLKTLLSKANKAEFIVTTEMADKLQRSDLYKLTRISHKEKLENLLMLQSDKMHESKKTVANLTSKNAALATLHASSVNTLLDHGYNVNQFV